jgi:predicted RNA-binding Zn ribbon-like protein
VERPLTGEPLAVDLLNTRWRNGDREVDLLDGLDGLAQWLDESGQTDVPATEPVRSALVRVRAVLHDVVEGQPGAQDELNAVLARGLTVRSLHDGRPRERLLLTDDSWSAAWRAADSYLDLVAQDAAGVRQCESPACVLYFFDPAGRRRWCSMAGCGNRAKARRHHARQHGRRVHDEAEGQGLDASGRRAAAASHGTA